MVKILNLLIIVSYIAVFNCQSKGEEKEFTENSYVKIENPKVPIIQIKKEIHRGMSIGEYGKVMHKNGIKNVLFHSMGMVDDSLKSPDTVISLNSELYGFLIGKDTSIVAEFVKKIEEEEKFFKLNKFFIISGRASLIGIEKKLITNEI